MADTVRERILQNLVTTLQGVTTSAGYATTLRKVTRIPASAFSLTELPMVMLVDASEEKEDGNPAQFTRCLLHLELICWNANYSTPSEEALKILGSVEKALYVDQRRGGLAIDTDVTGNETLIAEEAMPYGGVTIFMDVHYRHRLGDPYALT